MPIGIYEHKPHSDIHNRNISKNNACYWKGKKNPKQSKRMSGGRNPMKRQDVVDKVRAKSIGRVPWNKGKKTGLIMYYIDHPEKLEKILRNGYGKKCYSDDGLYFPSLQERDCYYWARDDVDEVMGIEHNFLDRFDFLLILTNGNEVVLEYHPKKYWLDRKNGLQYYKERRKLLDEIGYRNLKLIVMTSLKDKEKNKVINKIKSYVEGL